MASWSRDIPAADPGRGIRWRSRSSIRSRPRSRRSAPPFGPALIAALACLAGAASPALAFGPSNDHGHVGRGLSVWYRWTAPSSGEVAIDTLGSDDFWTVIAVYEGTTVAALTEVAANSGYWGDQASFVRFAVVAGREYRIAIDSSGGTGQFTLNWIRP